MRLGMPWKNTGKERGINMGGIGSNKGSANNTYFFRMRRMGDMVAEFNSKTSTEIQQAFQYYAMGVYGDENDKDKWDRDNKISEFIESNTNLKLKNTTLYRGVVLTDAELAALKVGQDANIKGLTSWSDREMVGHMYAVGSDGYTMGDKKGNPVVFIDANTNDAVANPYTYPQNEGMRSKNMTYTVTKIQTQGQYTQPVGRAATGDEKNSSYQEPVTYVWVKHKRKKNS